MSANATNGGAPPPIAVSDVSKWFGDVVAVNGVSFEARPGITGLLGPNGAGKTTLLHLIAGLAERSRGEIAVLGEPVRDNPDIYRQLAFMPERETVYPFMSGRRLVEMSAKMRGLPDAADRAARAIADAGMSDAQDRRVGGYSRGMRQRIRLAAALVGDPEVVILDEPLNGTDPRQRVEFQDAMERLAADGKTILISSHILEEVETLAARILLMLGGKLAAEGGFREIRAALDERAYQVRAVADAPRKLAAAVVAMDSVDSVSVARDGSIIIYSRNVSELQRALPRLARDGGIRLTRVEPMDESLESLFEYIVER